MVDEKRHTYSMAAPLVASLHTVVQFASGMIWVHTAHRGQTLSTADGRILRTLASFITPVDPDVVADAADDPAASRRQIADLERIGALVSAVDAAVDENQNTPGSLVGQYLSPVSATLDRLAGALGAIGPEVAEAIRAETGIGA